MNNETARPQEPTKVIVTTYTPNQTIKDTYLGCTKFDVDDEGNLWVNSDTGNVGVHAAGRWDSAALA